MTLGGGLIIGGLLALAAGVSWRVAGKGAQMVEEDAAVYEQQQEVMRDRTLDEHHDFEWNRMPVELRQMAVTYLRSELAPSTLSDVALQWRRNPSDWWAAFHFFGGMEVRNLLRQIIKDSELPSGNWDDYYCRALECAAGVREI